MEPLLHTLWDLRSSGPALFPQQGCARALAVDRDPQTFTISTRPCTPRLAQHCRSSISLGHTPQPCMISALPARIPRPAELCRSSIWLGHAPQPCTISALSATPQNLCCTIFTLKCCDPKACHSRDPHTYGLHSARPCPPSLSRQGSKDLQVLHSAGL
jgi:hypothetical protein